MSASDPQHVPSRVRARFDEIVAVTDAVAARHLDADYAALCRRMAAVLARRRPSPLERREARTWAAGILHAVGWVNFLTDPSQQPHLTAPALAAAAGVGQSTVAAAFRTIQDTLDLVRLDPEWTRPSKLLGNPLAWIVLVDGLPVDVREAPREVQEVAFRQGLIPFVPGPARWGVERLAQPAAEERDADPPPLRPPPPGTPAALRDVMADVMAEAEAVVQQTLAAHPDATVDELNAALRTATARYNRRAQAELGGLAPAAVHELLAADWLGAGSAIRLDDSISLDELAPARTLHDARLALAMLAERGAVKATPNGNLPRAFVGEFRERMRPRGDQWDEPSAGPRLPNEEDCFPLHLPRVLLVLAGLVKRRRGVFSRTRRGEQLTAGARAGALLATLIRTHFRALNLAYLDGAGPEPDFQGALGYTLYRFSQVGAGWRRPGELTEALVLPGVRDALRVSRHFDLPALILETRFLRPLTGFGLAEARSAPREPGAPIARSAYRKSPLFDRAVRFRVASDGGAGRPPDER
ncbi:MAG: hypothetical protein AVDCRST_MAG11-1526 [uncultured Gemmatimonadaceae bacterium]|uniref:DUF6398 domain-containing protein n=1 Tax=uncultured Gemmatimonadaceae bacterium TaxID=246130 RepID=A0A6J4KQV1_9BACT|nr:MAG: hypothetical protein AVDCRST_MAG11-1526 [uncultured Gemmatimonadaceae bacterium]